MSGRSATGTPGLTAEDLNLGPIESLFYWPEEPLGFLLSSRWIPDKSDHGKLYANINYQVLDNVRVGLDWRPLTDDVSILANWRIFPENDSWRPALIVGTSHDDFGDIGSQSYYGSFTKHLFELGGVNVSAYAGATFIEELNDLRPVGGMFLRYQDWSSMLMYSGVDEHFSLSKDFGNHTISYILFDLKLSGVSYSFRF